MQLKKFKILLIIILAHFTCANCFAAQSILKTSADAMQAFMNRYKEKYNDMPRFKKSCAGAGGTCVTAYKDINVQMLQALQIATEHVKRNKGWNVECSPTYRTDWNDDYIKCGDTDPTHAFEFQFDDIKESFDDTIQENVANAICKMYAGQRLSSVIGCSVLTERATPFAESINSFGYTAKCDPAKNFPGRHLCSVNFNARSGNTLRTTAGINNKKFHNLHIQSNHDLLFLLKRYTERMIKESGGTLAAFECNKSFNTYYTDEFFNPKDDILTCYVNGNPVDFLFDDMNEALDYEANSGTAGLNCIADAGGTFDGKNCHGLTREQCNELNSKLPGGTTWDTTLDTCILNDAQTASKLNQYVNEATNSLIATGLITITILTAGSVTVILVASVAGVAGTGLSMQAQRNKEAETRQFIANSSKCTQEDCALGHLKTFIEQISQYHNDLDGQLLDAIDEEIERLLRLNPTILETAINQAKENSDSFANIANWTSTEWMGFTGNVLSTIGAVAGITSGAKTGWQAITHFLKSKQPTPKTIQLIADTASTIDGSKTIAEQTS